MSAATEDVMFCIFCEDIRQEVNGLMSVMGWLRPGLKMPPEGSLTLPKLCAVIQVRRPALTPMKSLRITMKLDGKVLHQLSPTPEALAHMQASTLQEADALGFKGLTVKLNMQMMFFKVDEPGVLRAYAEIDGQPEIESEGLRFVR